MLSASGEPGLLAGILPQICSVVPGFLRGSKTEKLNAWLFPGPMGGGGGGAWIQMIGALTINNTCTFTYMKEGIRKTLSVTSIPPYTPLFIAKLGYEGVYLFLLFLLQNIDCGYSLEPHRRGGSNVYPQSMI